MSQDNREITDPDNINLSGSKEKNNQQYNIPKP